MFVYIDNKQEEKLKSYPYIQCAQYDKPSKELAFEDYLLKEEKINLMECYCWPELQLKLKNKKNLFDTKFLMPN